MNLGALHDLVVGSANDGGGGEDNCDREKKCQSIFMESSCRHGVRG